MAYVDKAKLMSHIETELMRWGESEYNALQILGDIEDFPTADVVEVKHGGKWLKLKGDTPKAYKRVCSECGEVVYYVGKGCSYKSCPHCLVIMDGKQEE